MTDTHNTDLGKLASFLINWLDLPYPYLSFNLLLSTNGFIDIHGNDLKEFLGILLKMRF